MKTLTIRLPDALFAAIEKEAERRGVPKSDVVRERLMKEPRKPDRAAAIADLIGSVDGLPQDLSERTKERLKSTGYGENRAR
jgi:hypothetical protein